VDGHGQRGEVRRGRAARPLAGSGGGVAAAAGSGGAGKAAGASWPVAVESMQQDLWGGEVEIANACRWGLQSAHGCCCYNLFDNFQGSMIRAGTRHDLSQVKQEMNGP
jgi:hypothetical protein